MRQHPLSAAFPSMTEVEFDSLLSDIKERGQIEPGVLFEEMVLDGWHRFRACELAGLEFVATVYTGDDPVGFVRAKNRHRRHLSLSQFAAIEVSLNAWGRVGRPSNSAPGAELTAKQMAEKAGVSERTIEYAKTAQKAGLGEAVRDGKMSAKAAATAAKNAGAAEEKANLGAGTPSDSVAPAPESYGPDEREQARAAEEIAIRDAAEKKAHERLAFILIDEDDPLNAVMAENVKLTQLLAVAQSRIAGLQGENGKLITEIKKLQRKSK